MSTTQFFTLCCVTLAFCSFDNATKNPNGPTTDNNNEISRFSKRDKFDAGGLGIGVIYTIITLITSTVGLATPSETDLRLDTVIATLDKIESHLAKLDSTLMDVFDVKDIKQLKTQIVGMKDKFQLYMDNRDDVDARDDYIRSCKRNDPQTMVTLLHQAQLGVQLFGGKKLSDFCIAYRSKDLYLYAVSPYLTARRIVLYAQEAAVQGSLCMVARNMSNTYINASASLMLTRIKELNQSLDAALRMEETRVRYVIRQPPECTGAQTSLDRLGIHYTVFYKCDIDKLEESFKWKFEFVEMVAPPTAISKDIQKTKPVYCTQEMKQSKQALKYYDVKDVPRFAAGYAQFNNQSAFRMRNLYRNETLVALIKSVGGWSGKPCRDYSIPFCDKDCDLHCNLLQLARFKNSFDPSFEVFKIMRNPLDSKGVSTFTFAVYWSPKNVLSWLGHPCYCTFFIEDNSDHRKWYISGMDTAGKITPLV